MDLLPPSGSGFEVWIFLRLQVQVSKYGSSSVFRFRKYESSSVFMIRLRSMDLLPYSGSGSEVWIFLRLQVQVSEV
jgi:hypothetical protein